MSRLRLAVIDDEEIVLKTLAQIFKEDYELETFPAARPALRRQEEAPFDIVLCDIRLPDEDGLAVLKKLKTIQPATEVILITGYATVDNAVTAVKEGAFYYLAKPFTPAQVKALVGKAAEHRLLALENQRLHQEIKKYNEFKEIVGISSKIKDLFEAVAKIAPIDCSVLIQGESGTGKELLARAIHRQSRRAQGPFVVCNCGGFPEGLIANELFGHERGAFTGATATKIGLMEAAHGGTLFLDEIGEMSPAMQIKLLRALQERQITRLGSVKPIDLDLRIIAATHRELSREVEAGRFRQDLYYRLKVVLLRLPPLRERKEDIPVLLNHFLDKYNRAYQKQVQGFSRSALEVLMNYSYPGNVRELENIVASALALTPGPLIRLADLPEDLTQLEVETLTPTSWQSLMEVEKDYLQRVLAATNHNKLKAAKILKIPRTTLWRKIRKYGLED